MPPKRKRKATTNTDKHQPSISKRSRSSQQQNGLIETEFSTKRCQTWFYEYANNNDSNTVCPEGMEKFCEDVGVEPENVVMLVLAWKLDALQMGFFSQQEWMAGMTSLQVDSTKKLQQKLEHLRSLLNEPSTFKQIYRYAFDFARDKGQRSLDIDTAKAMLALLLGKKWPLFGSFHHFLEQSKYKVINKDQWCNILEFSRTISPNLSNYDEDGAWPVILDEFVEWYKSHH